MSLTKTVPAAVPSDFPAIAIVPSDGREEQRAVELVRSRGFSIRFREDVLDQHGARGGAVGLPQLIAVGAVGARRITCR